MILFEKYADLAAEYDFEDFCNLMSTDIKQRDHLTWEDVRDIINYLYNVNYSTSCYKSKFQRRKLCNDLFGCLDDEPSKNIEIDEKILELAKAKVKLSDERVQLNALIRKMAREETIKEIAYNVAEKMNACKQLDYSYDFSVESPIQGLLLIGDWHYGIVINNMFNKYDTEIVKERVNKLLNKVISICHRDSIKKLHVTNLGDMIAGDIHLPLRINSRVDVITQVLEVSEIIAEFLNELSAHVQVSYCSTLDNHSRIDPNKANSIELESLARITDWYLKARLPQVKFTCDEVSDIASVSIFNHNIAFVHGHKDKQSNMISSINNFSQVHYDMICSAHMHHFSANEECGTFMLANGSLMGTDDHAYDLRLHSSPSQTLIEITKNNVVECIRKIDV